MRRTSVGRSSSPLGLCIPTIAPKAPEGPLWIHEIKHDGYRMLAKRAEATRQEAQAIVESSKVTWPNA